MNSLNFAMRVADHIHEADKLITMGMTPTMAARSVGVPPSTMRYWRDKVEEAAVLEMESRASEPVTPEELEDPFGEDAPF